MSTEHKSRKNRVGLIILLVLIVAAVVVIVINPFEGLAQMMRDQAAGQTETAVEDTVLSVRVAPVVTGDLRAYIKTNGNVVDTKTVDIYPDVAGKLSFMELSVGDSVDVDQVVARIDPSRPGMNFRETVVESPVKGTVLSVNFAAGATVSPQAALVRVGMLDNLEVDVAIAEQYIGEVGIGTEATATFQAYPGETFTGRVVRLSPVLDPVTRTLKVGIALDDPERKVKAGMFPSLVIYTETVEDALIVGRSSILYDQNQPYVYVVDDRDIARRQDIELALVVDENAQVVKGLASGDNVVIQGQTLLTDGAAIRVLD